MDGLTRAARASQEQFDEVTAAAAEAADHQTRCRARLGELDARISGLTSSDLYRQGQQLDQLRLHHGEATEAAARARASASRDAAAVDPLDTETATAERAAR